MKNGKSTTALRVVISDSLKKSTARDEIRAVHAALGPTINDVVQTFASTLNQLLN